MECLGIESDVVEGIIELVCNAGGKRADCSHAASSSKLAFSFLQPEHHAVDGYG